MSDLSICVRLRVLGRLCFILLSLDSLFVLFSLLRVLRLQVYFIAVGLFLFFVTASCLWILLDSVRVRERQDLVVPISFICEHVSVMDDWVTIVNDWDLEWRQLSAKECQQVLLLSWGLEWIKSHFCRRVERWRRRSDSYRQQLRTVKNTAVMIRGAGHDVTLTFSIIWTSILYDRDVSFALRRSVSRSLLKETILKDLVCSVSWVLERCLGHIHLMEDVYAASRGNWVEHFQYHVQWFPDINGNRTVISYKSFNCTFELWKRQDQSHKYVI